MGWFNNSWNYRQKITLDHTKTRKVISLADSANSGDSSVKLAGTTDNFYRFREGEVILLKEGATSETLTISSINTGTNTTLNFTTNLSNDYSASATVQINDNFSNFPIKITESNLDSEIFTRAKSQGEDIVFTSSDGTTQLKHEIIKFDTSGNELAIFVKIPSLSPTSDTDIYIYYGNSVASNQEDPENVWDDFLRVYHLNDDGSSWTSDVGADDAFTGNDGDSPNENRWYVDGDVIQINSNKLHFDPDSNEETSLVSQFGLSGNFDIQIDFSDLTLPDSGSGTPNFFRLLVEDPTKNSNWSDGNLCYIGRYRTSGDQGYRTALLQGGSWVGSTDSSTLTDSSGKLRIVRENTNDFKCYYWNGSSWTLLETFTGTWSNNCIIKIEASLEANYTSFESYIDNFTLNTGTILPPLYDSTSNKIHALNVGASSASGADYNRLDFDGSSDYINLNWYRDVSTNPYIDFESIIEYDVLDDQELQGVHQNTNSRLYHGIYSTYSVRKYAIGSSFNDTSPKDANTGNLYHCSLQTHEVGSYTHANMAQNGDTVEHGANITQSSLGYSFCVGARNNLGTIDHHINGKIQEVRISSVARSMHWKYAEYNNLLDASNFYSTSSLETLATEELEDVDNDIRTLKLWAIDDISNDFRMEGITEELNDLTNDFRIAGIELYNLLNDFRMAGHIVREHITSDIRTKLQVLSDISNKFKMSASVLSDISNKFAMTDWTIYSITNAVNFVKSILSDVSCDIRTRRLEKDNITNDFRMIKSWQKPGDAGFQSRGKEYIKVYIDSVLQTDLDIDSVNITHNLDSPFSANFVLAKAFDSSKPSQKSEVEIYYDEFLLFKGYIVSITPSNDPEGIKVNCKDEYWNLNLTKKYFMVGHEPIDTNDFYFETIKDALQNLNFNYDIGNFIPQTMDLYGTGKADCITELVNTSGNYSWFIAPKGTYKLHIEGRGTVVDLNAQSIGSNLGLYDVLSHDFEETIDGLINRLRVQMGTKTIRQTPREGSSTSKTATDSSGQYTRISYYSNFLEPVWDSELETLAKDSDDGYGFDYQNPDVDYSNVFRKFRLPGIDSDKASWSDIVPPIVEVKANQNIFSESLEFTKEGFTIDYEGVIEYEDIAGRLAYKIRPIVTFTEPQFYKETNEYGELTSIRRKNIKMHLAQEKRYSYNNPESGDSYYQQPDSDTEPITNELMFYTDKMGTYPDTITGFLELGGLTVQEGYTFNKTDSITGERIVEHIPSWDDTEYAEDYADWQLSKTAYKKVKGTIELTIDSVCYHGLDLSKRVNIDGVLDDPINIKSITYNVGNFTCSLELESGHYYKRTVSLPYHGE